MSEPRGWWPADPRAWLGVAALGLLAAAGCGGRGFAEVTGTVLIDGAPLPGAFVTFVPEGPDAVRGVGSTNDAGRYRVIRPGGKIGAMIGTNRVRVTGGDAGRALPPQYNTQTTLRCDVKRGANVYDIEITTK